MKKRFLGLVCFIYAGIIIYVKLSGNLGNYLAPQMQKYLIISVIPLIILGLVLCINNNIHYKFKISDLILLLPLILLIIAGDGKLSMNLVSNRNNSFNSSNQNKEGHIENSETQDEDNNLNEEQEEIDIDFTDVDYEVEDASYDQLANIITYSDKPDFFVGKKIRVRGFIVKKGLDVLPKGYIAIGKYSISCCAADAGFLGFIAKTNQNIIHNKWYEIEGILEKAKDKQGYGIVAVKIINVKEKY